MRTRGYVDVFDNGNLLGWAMDESCPETPVVVCFYREDICIGKAHANLFREDLRRAAIGNGTGKYGFCFPVPQDIRSSGRYKLSVKSDGQPLVNSPFEVIEEVEPFRRRGGHVRDWLGRQYCLGTGLEIGALHKPMPVPGKVAYVDTRTKDDLMALYGSEVAGHELVPIDYLTDATTLTGIPDSSQDFVIANQVIEHLENPALAIQNMLRVVKAGGYVFLSIPDKRYTFDVNRPVTTFEHILHDYREGPEWARQAHYEEWIQLVEQQEDRDGARLHFLMNIQRYPIHFHVWTQFEMIEMFRGLREYEQFSFEIDCFKANDYEALFVLRKLTI